MDNTPLNAAQAETGLSAFEAAQGLARDVLNVLPGGQHRARLLAMDGMSVVAASLFVMGCSSDRFDVQRPPPYAIKHPEATSLGRAAGEQLKAAPGQSGFHLLVSGQEAFLARAALAEASEKTLDLQYYIVGEDASATLLLYRALRAAQRGVRV